MKITMVWKPYVGYAVTDIWYPEDGSGYGPSIRRTFSEHEYDRIMEEAGSGSFTEQEQAYARSYLQGIGRDAEIREQVDRQVSDLACDEEDELFKSGKLSGYPDWIGAREQIEDGVRYVYEKAVEKTDTGWQLVYRKYEYDSKDGRQNELTIRLDAYKK